MKHYKTLLLIGSILISALGINAQNTQVPNRRDTVRPERRVVYDTLPVGRIAELHNLAKVTVTQHSDSSSICLDVRVSYKGNDTVQVVRLETAENNLGVFLQKNSLSRALEVSKNEIYFPANGQNKRAKGRFGTSFWPSLRCGVVLANEKSAETFPLTGGIDLGLDIVNAYYKTVNDCFKFSVGFGFAFKSLGFAPNLEPILTPDNGLQFQEFQQAGKPEQLGYLSYLTMELPVMMTWRIATWHKIVLGVAGILNTDVSTQFDFDDCGTHVSKSITGVRANPFAYEFRACYLFSSLGVYLHYSPCKLFSKSFGPESTTTAAGLYLQF